MSREECTDFSPAMNWTAIPEQVDRSAQMTQEVTEKGLDVDTGEVMRTTPEVERHPPMLWRDGHPAADRQPIVAIPVPDTWGLPLRRPSAPNIWDEQEPALIDEHEMGPTSSGVFLTVASPSASSARWPPRRARRRDARASGSSSPTPSAPSSHARGRFGPGPKRASGRQFHESPFLPGGESRCSRGLKSPRSRGGVFTRSRERLHAGGPSRHRPAPRRPRSPRWRP